MKKKMHNLAKNIFVIMHKKLLLFFCISAFSTRLFFLFYAGRTWEDALITATYARNLVSGYGLIHHISETPVQGFTSPLSVAVVSLGEIVFPENGILLMKTVSLFSSILTIAVAYKIAQRLAFSFFAKVFLLSFLSFEFNQIYFGMSGMESQVTTMLLLSGLYFHMSGNIRLTSIVSALFILTRPDAFIWVSVLFFCYLLYQKKNGMRMMAFIFSLTFPWYLFTLLYFKSFVPHNLLAKSVAFITIPSSIHELLFTVAEKLYTNSSYFWRYFSPFLNHDFVIDAPYPIFILGILGLLFIALSVAGLWHSKKNRILLPAVLYVCFFLLYRLIFLPQKYFVWHLMPFMAFTALFASISISLLEKRFQLLARLISFILAAFFLIPLFYLFPMEKIIQRDVENQVRRKIGEYLSTHVLPQETVFSESLGYIGYFAGQNVVLYDYPGLASPTVLNTLKKIPPNQRDYIYPVISILEPDKLILRITEYEDLRIKFPSTFSHYRIEKTFAKSEPGIILDYHKVKMLNVDTFFYLLEKFKI